MYSSVVDPDDEASLALARRLQAEEFGFSPAVADGFGNQPPPTSNYRYVRRPSREDLLGQERQNEGRDLLVQNANQVVYDVRSSGRFIALALLVGLIELLSGLIVLGVTWSSVCNGPMRTWLIVFLMRHLMIFPQECLRYVAHSRRLDRLMATVQASDRIRSSVVLILIFMGLIWILGSADQSCRMTSPILWNYTFVLILLHIGIAFSPIILLAMFCLCMPCLLLLLRFFQPNEGMSSNDLRNLPEHVFAQTNDDATSSCVIRASF